MGARSQAESRANSELHRETASILTQGVKRSPPAEAAEPQFVKSNGELEVLEYGLRAWGYMPGHVHYKVGYSEDAVSCSHYIRKPC